MGRINNFGELEHLVNLYNIYNYVETGVGDGTSMRYMLSHFNFKNYAIDLDKNMCDAIENSWMGTRVSVFHGYSHEAIKEVLALLDYMPTLFWLDAHFPNADYNGAAYDAEQDEKKRIPLEAELRKIVAARHYDRDLFVIDDLRIYEDGPYETGSWPLKSVASKDGCGFVDEVLGETHHLLRSYRDQGYLICAPRTYSRWAIEHHIWSLG